MTEPRNLRLLTSVNTRHPSVLRLCHRVADKLTREAQARGDGFMWYADRNEHGYPQVLKVRFE